jgi:hypothetical protein
LALEAFAKGAVDPKMAVQTLEQCVGSVDAGIRAVAACNLIDRQPQHTIALRCLTNAVTDPSLWNRDGYHPATPKSVIARLVRPGIVTPPIMSLVRQQAAEHERERIVDDALKALRTNR